MTMVLIQPTTLQGFQVMLHFNKSCSVSRNTSEKILRDGDIVNVDVTALKNGWHGDTSRTFEIGEVSIKAKNW